MDGVIEDIAAVGVDHVDRHLAAAVVHLVAHGSVAVNLGIAQHEVIILPLDGIAPARDVFVRANLERHPVGTQRPEAVADPGQDRVGTAGGRNIICGSRNIRGSRDCGDGLHRGKQQQEGQESFHGSIRIGPAPATWLRARACHGKGCRAAWLPAGGRRCRHVRAAS